MTFVHSICHVSSTWHVSSIWHVSWVNSVIKSNRGLKHRRYCLFVCVYNSQQINQIPQNSTVFAPHTTVFAPNTTVFTPNTTVYGQITAVFAPKYYCIYPPIPLYWLLSPLYLPQISLNSMWLKYR